MSAPTVNNASSDLQGKTLATLEDNQTVTGLKTFSRGTGAPFAVPASSATVTNLDADTVDGQHASAFVIPSGGLLPFGGTVIPSGYLLCDGSAVSRSTYSVLFGVIGTAYGTGDGSTTFNVPNLQQKFPLGKAASGTGSTLGATGGSIDHTHSMSGPSVSVNASGVLDLVDGASSSSKVGMDQTFGDPVINLRGVPNSYTSGGIASDGTEVGAASHTHTTSVGAVTAGTANPPFVTFNFIIKT